MIGSRRERKATPLARIRGKFAEEVSEKCDNSAESQKLPSRVAQPRTVRRQAGIMSMAVGRIVRADQAEAILQKGQAALVALAREVLYNPNWPMARRRRTAPLSASPRLRRGKHDAIPYHAAARCGAAAAHPARGGLCGRTSP